MCRHTTCDVQRIRFRAFGEWGFVAQLDPIQMVVEVFKVDQIMCAIQNQIMELSRCLCVDDHITLWPLCQLAPQGIEHGFL